MMGEQLCYMIIFLSEALIAWLYLDYLFSRKNKGLLCFFMFFAGYALLYAVSLLQSSAANTISFCVVNFLLALLNYNCSSKTALLHAGLLTFIMAIAEILMALVITLFGNAFTAYTEDVSVLIAMAVTSKLLYLVMAIIGLRLFTPNKHQREDPQLMALFCGLPLLSSAMAILVIYLGASTKTNRATEILMTVTVLALLLVNVCFIFLYNHAQRMNEEYTALQLSLQKDQADAVYYQTLQEQLDNQRILVHDIKNHLHTLDGLANSGKSNEIRAYISNLELSLESDRKIRYSSDSILNLILLHAQEQCEQHQITFHADIRDSCLSFMDGPGKTALFGNLLANAIESAVCSENRMVEISICRLELQSVAIISVKNSCDQPPVEDSIGGFQTRKSHKEYHGIGLRSIYRIIRRYHGVATMRYDAERKCFHHIIQFPISQSNDEKTEPVAIPKNSCDDSRHTDL